MYLTSTPSACTGFIAAVTALRLASFTLVAGADHCTWPSATWPLGDTRRLWKGLTTETTCGTDLSLPKAVTIAALAAGSVTFVLPAVAKTIVLWPPLKAGSWGVGGRVWCFWCRGGWHRRPCSGRR